MLTVDQQLELSNVLAAIDLAEEKGQAYRVAELNGRPVVKTAAKANIFKRAWLHRHQSGEKLLRNRLMAAVQTMKQQPIDQLLQSQIFEGASRYSFLSKGDVSVIQAQEKLLIAPARIPTPKPPAKPIKTRKVRKPLPDMSHVSYRPVSSQSTERHRWDLSKTDYHPVMASPASSVKREGWVDFTPVPIGPITEESHSEAFENDEEGLTIPYVPPTEEDFEEESVWQPKNESSEHSHNLIDFEPVTIPQRPTPKPRTKLTTKGSLELVPKEETIKPLTAREKLNEAHHDLNQKLFYGKTGSSRLNVTLADARPFLRAYYESVLVDGVDNDEYNELYDKLTEHFNVTHQKQAFKKLDLHALWLSIEQVKTTSPEAYLHCLDVCERPSSRMTVISRMVAQLMEVAHRNPPHIQGHPAEKVSLAQINFLKDVDAVDELMWQIHLEVTDEDESETTTEFNADLTDFLKKLSDDVAEYSQENEDFQALMEQLADIDPEVIENKIKAGTLPSEDELILICQCHHQILKVETSLGRTWDLGVLTDQQFWPDDDSDGYNAFMKMLHLSELETPDLQATRRKWLALTNAANPNPPKVVVEASDYKGYLLALSQFSAGANVTMLSSEHTRPPGQILRLDPITVNMLRFHLPDQFDELFGHQEEDSGMGVIRPDGFGEISADALERALRGEINSLKTAGARGLTLIEGSVEHLIRPDGHKDPYQLQIVEPLSGSPKAQVSADMLILTNQPASRLQNKFSADNSPLTPEDILAESTMALSLNPLEDTENVEQLSGNTLANDYSKKTDWGQCSWASEGINNSSLTTFNEDPLQSTVLDTPFYERFQQHITSRLNQETLPAMGVTKTNFNAIKPDSDSFKRLVTDTDHQCLKTWCLENPHHVHIEMELPAALHTFLAVCKNEMARVGTDQTTIATVLQNIHEAWFQAVADQQGGNSIGLRPEHIQSDSLAIGKLANHNSEANLHRQEQEDSTLIMTTIGDSVASSRELGFDHLTAAREQILACEALTEARVRREMSDLEDVDDEDLEEELQNDIDDFEERYNHSREFLQQKMI